jgi:hypothetical protein
VGGAPGPLVGALAEAGPNWVLEDVLGGRGEVLAVLDREGGEAVAEEMAPALVALVEALGEVAVQPVEAVRDAVEGRSRMTW